MTEQRHAALGIHPIDPTANEDHGELMKRQQVVRRTKLIAIIVLILLALGAGRTIFSRMANAKALETGTAEREIQYVKTTIAKGSDASQTI
ncbi:MAG: efflux transporter periplasmic adaptor subunit, partial [Burkholderiales bacterium]